MPHKTPTPLASKKTNAPIAKSRGLRWERFFRRLRRLQQSVSPSAWIILFAAILVTLALLSRNDLLGNFPNPIWPGTANLPGAELPIPIGTHEVKPVEYLSVEIHSVQVKRSIGDASGRGDFRLLVILADTLGHSTATYCPGKNPLSIEIDQVFKPCGENAISLNKKDLKGDLYVYLIALDEDQASAGESLSLDGLSSLLAYGLGQFVGQVPAVTDIALDVILSQISDNTLQNYFQANTVLGDGVIRLSEEANWGMDTSPVVRTSNKYSSVEMVLNVRQTYSPGGVFRLDLYSTSPIIGTTYNPADFVRSYFKLVSQKKYQEAWGLYSPLYYEKQPEWLYQNFLEAWRPIKRVDVYDAKVEWWKPLTAKVTATMFYTYEDGRVDSNDIQSFYLKWDEKKQNWLIDEVLLVRTTQ